MWRSPLARRRTAGVRERRRQPSAQRFRSEDGGDSFDVSFFALSRGDYHYQHEPCWYAVRKGHNAHWTGDRKQTTLWSIANRNAFGGSLDDTSTPHGTQKPVECMRRPILNHTTPGQAVYDPFGGSGTTLIAAETTRRRCAAMEIDPVYVDVAVLRWQSYTGQAAILDGTSQTFDEIRGQRHVQEAG